MLDDTTPSEKRNSLIWFVSRHPAIALTALPLGLSLTIPRNNREFVRTP
jgi:hypothetical protein